MTAPLGSAYCIRTDLGCSRRRHVSPTGIAYSTCVSHARELLARAFGPDSPSRAAVASPRGSGTTRSVPALPGRLTPAR